jgi:hypothetical protein
VNVDTASILVEWIMTEGVEDEKRDEGLDGGGTCSTEEMTELTSRQVDLKDSESWM